MKNRDLYLKTAFCCMACDGDIAEEEVALLEKLTAEMHVFDGIYLQNKLNEFVSEINSQGKQFLYNYLEEIKVEDLNDDEALQLVKIAIETIEADNHIEYSELSFFKQIRRQLKTSDSVFLEALPDKEDYFLPDVNEKGILEWNILFHSFHFDNIHLSKVSLE